MDNITLGSKAEGSIVKLEENGALVDFYVAKHDYEPDLNGVGRTLLVRKDCYDKRQWGLFTSRQAEYAASSIDQWLNVGYKALLNSGIQVAMGVTRFYNIGSSMERSIFLLSRPELGIDSLNNVHEGTALPIANALKIAYLDGEPVIQWTRSPGLGADNIAYVVGANGESNLIAECGNANGTRPTFTLPASLYIRADGLVSTNTPPSRPRITSVPRRPVGGGQAVITWSSSTDQEGNLSGYSLERQADDGEWQEIYRGTNLTFTDAITKGWGSVRYRVRAYDDCGMYSGYSANMICTVNNNAAPVITCGSASGSDLGIKESGFSVDYTVTDEDNDTVTVTEALDGITKRTFTPTLGVSNSFAITGEAFTRILNGPHTLTITANDGQVSVTHRLSFTKAVHRASITLTEPMAIAGDITVAVLAVVGDIPEDANYKVEVTNNGKDPSPTWQDVTADVRSGANIVFDNHVAVNGAAFNFRVTVERGASGVGGYISAITGAFQ